MFTNTPEMTKRTVTCSCGLPYYLCSMLGCSASSSTETDGQLAFDFASTDQDLSGLVLDADELSWIPTQSKMMFDIVNHCNLVTHAQLAQLGDEFSQKVLAFAGYDVSDIIEV